MKMPLFVNYIRAMTGNVITSEEDAPSNVVLCKA